MEENKQKKERWSEQSYRRTDGDSDIVCVFLGLDLRNDLQHVVPYESRISQEMAQPQQSFKRNTNTTATLPEYVPEVCAVGCSHKCWYPLCSLSHHHYHHYHHHHHHPFSLSLPTVLSFPFRSRHGPCLSCRPEHESTQTRGGRELPASCNTLMCLLRRRHRHLSLPSSGFLSGSGRIIVFTRFGLSFLG